MLSQHVTHFKLPSVPVLTHLRLDQKGTCRPICNTRTTSKCCDVRSHHDDYHGSPRSAWQAAVWDSSATAHLRAGPWRGVLLQPPVRHRIQAHPLLVPVIIQHRVLARCGAVGDDGASVEHAIALPKHLYTAAQVSAALGVYVHGATAVFGATLNAKWGKGVESEC